jgi:hypothetical protein
MKRTILVVFVIAIFYNLIGASDMDFGIFQYQGSRLTKIKKYFDNIKRSEVEYKYDASGFLQSRIKNYIKQELFCEKRIPAYVSSLTYDLTNSVIYETFDRYDSGKKTAPVILEYYYDTHNRLINYKRKDGKVQDFNNITLSDDIDVRYNDKGDIIFTKGDEVYFPGDGIIDSGVNEFKYEYGNNIKSRLFEVKKGIWEPDSDFIFEKGKLIRYISFLGGSRERIHYTNSFEYNEKGNVIGNEILFYSSKGKLTSNDRFKYEYDEKNRLVRRIAYYPDYIAKDKIYSMEEYEYEDGPYIHYPYLLPTTKIKVYGTSDEDVESDRDVF